MPQTEPVAPPSRPAEEPETAPEPVEPAEPNPEPDPFDPDWPKERPLPPPKALIVGAKFPSLSPSDGERAGVRGSRGAG
jgi:hypothetical protein